MPRSLNSDAEAKRNGRAVDAEMANLLIREGEGLTVEFKDRYTPRIDQDIVAFANARGGTLLLGVRDDGNVVGERLTNDLKANINSLARNCKPGLAVEMAQVGRIVAVVIPEGAEKPYACGSGYYRRLDGSTQKMSHDELRIMFVENEPLPFEEKTVRDFSFDLISKEKIRAFAREAGINLGRAAIPDLLRSLDAADADRVKNVGILFFAKDVCRHIRQAQMTLVAFKGIDKRYVYDRRDVRDDLLTQFNEAMAFLERHLNVRSEIRGVNRVDIVEIPLEVLREAVVNALMHRDYCIAGTQVSVEIYDDRVEIVNPGGLPKGLTLKKFGSVSVRRNEIIADLFARMNKVERLGSGIRKMREIMAEAGLPEPMFDPNGFFSATFRRSPAFSLKRPQSETGRETAQKTTQKTEKKTTQETNRRKIGESREKAKRMAEKEVQGTTRTAQKLARETAQKTAQKIMALIGLNPRVTRQQLAKALGISDSGVKYQLKKLQENGTVRRVGSAKGGYWETV